jgi:serine protease Do
MTRFPSFPTHRSISAGALLLLILAFFAPRASATPPTTAPTDLESLQGEFQSVAARVSPAVVAISAAAIPDDSPSALRSQEMNPDVLQAFLSKTTRIVGAGCILSADGYILTNDHVIDGAQQLWITTDDAKVYPALVVGSDPRADLAVLKIPARNLSTIHFAAAPAQRGQWSLAIGNPFGLSALGEMSLSVGVVSAVNRSLPKLSEKENRDYSNLIQTSAQINPGNSGGPLFDLNGDMIGLNTAVVMPQKSTNGIGFAIPIDTHFLCLVADLRQGKEITYTYLGVNVQAPTESQFRAAGLQTLQGVRIDSILPDSPASHGQLLKDDLITAINNQPIPDRDTFVRLIGSCPLDHPTKLSLIRNGKPTIIAMLLIKRPFPVAAVTHDTQRLRWAGMLVGPIPAPPDSKHTGLMVFSIDAASPFTKQGIHSGSIITSISGKSVVALTQLQDIINDTPIDHCDIHLAAAVLPTDPDSAK